MPLVEQNLDDDMAVLCCRQGAGQAGVAASRRALRGLSRRHRAEHTDVNTSSGVKFIVSFAVKPNIFVISAAL